MEERNALRLLCGQNEEETKDPRAELDKAHQDQTDLIEQVIQILKAHGIDSGTVANISILQLQQKVEMIEQLREEVNMMKTETLGWKEGMDRFAAEKETALSQLSSAKSKLRGMKEKISSQEKKIEELKARLASELAKAKFEAEKAKAEADAIVVYRADAEASQSSLDTMNLQFDIVDNSSTEEPFEASGNEASEEVSEIGEDAVNFQQLLKPAMQI
ncbi:uncharacterized protein [Nicotiana tomentosiformis]|uniref:uncharacterized protein n=1 Tax=Nicotiana tomentosiformis TaxID=4098 RepID=UPI00388CAB6B